MKRRATELIHAARHRSHDAVPLTTPIYETTTFVFDTAAEVRGVQRGPVGEVSSTRATATRRSSAVEQKLAALDGAEAALLFSIGQAATATTLLAHRRRRATRWSAARRSTAARCTCCTICWRGSASRRGSSSLEELAAPERLIGERDAAGLVRVADQPDAALRRHRARSPPPAAPRGVISVIDNTFASPINQQPLALGVDLVDAERDEVSERPQRRHRRRAGRAGAR